jgi:hypothetical protein
VPAKKTSRRLVTDAALSCFFCNSAKGAASIVEHCFGAKHFVVSRFCEENSSPLLKMKTPATWCRHFSPQSASFRLARLWHLISAREETGHGAIRTRIRIDGPRVDRSRCDDREIIAFPSDPADGAPMKAEIAAGAESEENHG